MTTTIDPKTVRAAHVVEHGEGWSPRGTRMRVARPASWDSGDWLLDLTERACRTCGYHLCACAPAEAPPPLVDLPGEVVPEPYRYDVGNVLVGRGRRLLIVETYAVEYRIKEQLDDLFPGWDEPADGEA